MQSAFRVLPNFVEGRVVIRRWTAFRLKGRRHPSQLVFKVNSRERKHTFRREVADGGCAISLNFDAWRVCQRNKDFADTHFQQLGFQVLCNGGSAECVEGVAQSQTD